MKNIVLLHGALACADDLMPLAAVLRKQGMNPICFNFSGHGTKKLSGDFNLTQLLDELSQFIQNEKIAPVPIFGYSMGGYVALKLSLKQPQLFTHLITLATKLEWNPTIAAKEAASCDLQFLSEKAPGFLQNLKTKHANTEQLLQNTKKLLIELGDEKFDPLNFASISLPLLLNLGDRDKMVSLDETLHLFKNMPTAALSILPKTKHPLETVKPELLAKIISDFCS